MPKWEDLQYRDLMLQRPSADAAIARDCKSSIDTLPCDRNRDTGIVEFGRSRISRASWDPSR